MVETVHEVTELQWERLSDSHWRALDAGAVRYDARIGHGGAWRVTMHGFTIGEKGGFPNLAAAREYVDWGGRPTRMGWDRKTGEVFR